MKTMKNTHSIYLGLLLVLSLFVGLLMMPLILFVWVSLMVFCGLILITSKLRSMVKPKVRYAFYNGKLEKVVN